MSFLRFSNFKKTAYDFVFTKSTKVNDNSIDDIMKSIIKVKDNASLDYIKNQYISELVEGWFGTVVTNPEFLENNFSFGDSIFLFKIPAKILSYEEDEKTIQFLFDGPFYGRSEKCHLIFKKEDKTITYPKVLGDSEKNILSVFNKREIIKNKLFFNTNIQSFKDFSKSMNGIPDILTNSNDPKILSNMKNEVILGVLLRLLRNTLLKIEGDIYTLTTIEDDIQNLYLYHFQKKIDNTNKDSPTYLKLLFDDTKKKNKLIWNNDILTIQIQLEKNDKTKIPNMTLVYHIIHLQNAVVDTSKNDSFMSLSRTNLQESDDIISSNTDHQLFYCQYFQGEHATDLSKIRKKFLKMLTKIVPMNVFTNENRKEFEVKRSLSIANVEETTNNYVKMMDDLKSANFGEKNNIIEQLEKNKDHHFHMATTNQLLMDLSRDSGRYKFSNNIPLSTGHRHKNPYTTSRGGRVGGKNTPRSRKKREFQKRKKHTQKRREKQK